MEYCKECEQGYCIDYIEALADDIRIASHGTIEEITTWLIANEVTNQYDDGISLSEHADRWKEHNPQ